MSLPTSMKVLWYKAPGDFEITQISVPTAGDYELLIKVQACGLCRLDDHIDKGKFPAAFPLCTGFEVTGEVAAFGAKVEDFKIGNRCALDPVLQGDTVHCEKLSITGVTKQGGFSEYLTIDAKQAYKIVTATDEEAILVEPLACVMRALDKLENTSGITALVLGSGPSGIMFAQMLKINGAYKVVLASNKGVKLESARKLNCADEYIEIDRENPENDWETLTKTYPRGFDVVVEATGSTKVVQQSINFVQKGGSLLLYSLYDSQALVQWSPLQIFLSEIKIIASFAHDSAGLGGAAAYLDSEKLNLKGMVTDVFPIDNFADAFKLLHEKTATKIVIIP